jgi:hypothetical protein
MLYDIAEYAIAWISSLVSRNSAVMRMQKRTDSGQATPEYALVILAAVALAATLIVWAKKSGAIAELFEFVIGKVKEAADK